MSKRKYRKINITDVFDIGPDQTLIRPKSITINLENRGEDFKLEYKETFQKKQAPENQEWTIDSSLTALKQIKQDIKKHHKYFVYQIKPIKKGYELMIVSDDAFAILAGILSELLAFGIRETEDSINIIPLIESLLKMISKANIVDE